MGDFPIGFGRYSLVERLAVGGMAELFVATSPGEHGFQKKVVIKRLLPHLADDQTYNAMFIDEAKLTARLVHPKIAQTFELGKVDDALYIAMEHIDGIDVLALLREFAARRRRVEPQLAVWIAHEVLDALDYAHALPDEEGRAMGVVHRDISPSNVLLSLRGDVKLVDFGIARAKDPGRAHKSKSGTLKGKYGYMSPEQVVEQAVDARSDVFSVGVVLAELLTGRRLFAAPNELDVLLMVRDAKLTRLDKYGLDIEPALNDIVRKALRKSADDRWQSAAAFRDALAEWLFDHRHRMSNKHVADVVQELRDAVAERRGKAMADGGHTAQIDDPSEKLAEASGTGAGGGGVPMPADEKRRRPQSDSDGAPIMTIEAGDSMPMISVSYDEGGEGPAKRPVTVSDLAASATITAPAPHSPSTRAETVNARSRGTSVPATAVIPPSSPHRIPTPPDGMPPVVPRAQTTRQRTATPAQGIPPLAPRTATSTGEPEAPPAAAPPPAATPAPQPPQNKPITQPPQNRPITQPPQNRPATDKNERIERLEQRQPSGEYSEIRPPQSRVPTGERQPISRARTSDQIQVSRTTTPSGGRQQSPPAVSRTTTPGARPVVSRTTTPSGGRQQSPPTVSRTTTPSTGRTPTPPSVGRTPTPERERNRTNPHDGMTPIGRTTTPAAARKASADDDAALERLTTTQIAPIPVPRSGGSGSLDSAVDTAIADTISAAVEAIMDPESPPQAVPRRSEDLGSGPVQMFDEPTEDPPRKGDVPLPSAEEIARARPPIPPALADIPEPPDDSGEFSTTSPLRVLFRLMTARATGLLVVAVGGIKKEIYVRDGQPEYVSSNVASELFGNYLVTKGVMSEGELAMALAMMPHYGGKLGDTLVGLGLLKPLEVFRHLTRQVRSKIIDVCTWNKGGFGWYAGRENPREAFPLDFNAFEILGAGAMALEEPVIDQWIAKNAAQKLRASRTRRVGPERFEVKGLVELFESLDGRRSISDLVEAQRDRADRIKIGRMLCLLEACDLAKAS